MQPVPALAKPEDLSWNAGRAGSRLREVSEGNKELAASQQYARLHVQFRVHLSADQSLKVMTSGLPGSHVIRTDCTFPASAQTSRRGGGTCLGACLGVPASHWLQAFW